MKRILPIILLVAMAICLTSCNPDSAAKLGELMGKMGNNVYGITANMKDVNKATDSINNAIKPDGSGNYDKNELMKANSIVGSISSITNSQQKIDQLKAELDQPAATPENNENLRDALLDAKDDISTKVAAISGGLGALQQNMVDSVLESLGEIVISPTPTKAEVVTLAVLNEIADSVIDFTKHAEDYTTGEGTALSAEGQQVVDRVLSCIETLKVVTSFGGLDLLAGISPSAIMEAMSGEDRVLRAEGDNEAMFALLEAVGNPIGKFKNLLVDVDENENVSFSPTKWATFVFQARTIKAAYEMVGCMYMPFQANMALIDQILTYDIDLGLTVDDFVLYFVSVLACTADTIKETIQWVAGFGQFIVENFDELEGELDDATDLIFPLVFEAAWEGLKAKLVEMTSDGHEAWAVLSTVAVLLNDSGYSSILKLSGGDGSVSSVFNMITNN